MTLIEFLRARLDEDEQWALACNLPYRFADEGSKVPDTGVHWQWVTGENWDPVTPDPVTMEVVEGPDKSWSANLSTVEQWPNTWRNDDGTVIRESTMPRTYANSIDEMDPAAAGHIARHDPARVLAEVDAKRHLLALHEHLDAGLTDPVRYPHNFGCLVCHKTLRASIYGLGWCQTLRLLALPFASHADYDPSWRPA